MATDADIHINKLYNAVTHFLTARAVGGMMCQPPNMARALGLYDLRFIAVTTPSPVSISSSPHASVPSHP